MTSVGRDLRADTALTPDPDVAGRYHADVSDGWKIRALFGGVSMYTALRAMAEHLDRPNSRS